MTTSNHVLAKARHGQIEGKGQEIWTHERLKIPAVPPSYLKYCDLIDIQYFVEVRMLLIQYRSIAVFIRQKNENM